MDPFLNDDAQTAGKLDPIQILRMFWRRRWLFVVPFIICAVVAAVAIRIMTPIYESAGQIRVVYELSRSRLLDDVAPSFANRNMEQETLNTIWTIVTAPRFLENAARRAGMTGAEADTLADQVEGTDQVGISELSRPAARLKKLIRVRPDGAQIFEIAVRSSDPAEARRAAQVVLGMFLEVERQSRMAPKATTREFLERQISSSQANLKGAEDRLSAFEGSLLRSTLGGNPVNAANIVTVEVNLRTLLDQIASSDRQELQALGAQAQSALPDLPVPSEFLAEPDIAASVRQITEFERARLLGGPTAATLENDLGRERLRLSNLLDASVQRRVPGAGVMDRTRVVRYVLQALRNRAREDAAGEAAAAVREYRDFTARQPAQSARLTELQLEVQRQRDLLAQLEREYAQTTMNLEASASEIGYRIEVRRDPALPKHPIEPAKLRLYVMGIGLSIAIGLGLVVLSILLDRSFTDIDSIERVLKVAVIGTLPMVEDDHFHMERKRRILRWTIIVVATLAVAVVFLFVLYPRLN